MLTALLFAACEKEGPAGPAGPPGNANVDLYTFSLNLSAYYHYGSSDVWAEPAPSSVRNIGANEAALVYIWMDPVVNSSEWVEQPYIHYFNGTSNFNEFFHGVEEDGDLWLYIRNSAAGQPFSTMSGALYYKVFIVTSRVLDDMHTAGIDTSSYAAVARFLSENDHLSGTARMELTQVR